MSRAELSALWLAAPASPPDAGEPRPHDLARQAWHHWFGDDTR